MVEWLRIARLRTVTRLFVIALAFLLLAVPAHAEKRVALVIGNASYSGLPKLANPEHDARAIAKMLADLGFDVGEAQLDLGFTQLNRALSDLYRKAADADLAVVYFAGHGIEFDGVNWLIPVDARLESNFDVEGEAVSLYRVMRAMQRARLLRLVILDACRNDPYQRPWRSASRNVGSRGLAPIEDPPANTLVAYAARAGTVAIDGKAGENSPYTKALLKYLPEQGVDVELAFRHVRDDVLAATGMQEPFKYGSLGARPILLNPERTAEPATGNEAQLLKLADELRKEFDNALQTLAKTSFPDFSRAQSVLEKLKELDDRNGHVWYFSGEIKRLSLHARFTEGCVRDFGADPRDSLYSYHDDFRHYLDFERSFPKSETSGSPGVLLCRDRPKGFCVERTAWINHLLANDLFRQGEATADKLVRAAKLKRAKEFATEALRYTRIGGEAGFTDCIPTISLIERIDASQ